MESKIEKYVLIKQSELQDLVNHPRFKECICKNFDAL